MTECLNVNIGGYRYTLDVVDVQKFPTSKLAALARAKSSDEIIEIDRDGRIFQYIASYIVCGQIPRNADGTIRLATPTLILLKAEAKYFGLDQLLVECDRSCKCILSSDFHTYLDMHKYIQQVRMNRGQGEGTFKVDFTYAYTTPLLQALSGIWAPFCITGKTYAPHESIYLRKNCTFVDLKLDELVESATADSNQTNAYFIPVCDLNKIGTEQLLSAYYLENMAPNQEVTIVCDRLFIHRVGFESQFHPASALSRGEGHIGTLVVILNSEYTGGELEVTHGGRIEVVTGPYHWVAMYGDCLHKINPVTSGTRVSLIYDIYATPRPTRESSIVVDELKFFQSVWVRDLVEMDKARGANERATTLIKSLVCTELVESDTIYIALQRLYPSYLDAQLVHNLSELNYGDKAIYDILAPESLLDVSFRLVTVYQTSREWFTTNYQDRYSCTATAQLFPTSPCIRATTAYVEESQIPLPKRQKCDSSQQTSVKLIVATELAQECLMNYSKSAEWTGTESLPEMAVYVVRALQVRKRGFT